MVGRFMLARGETKGRGLNRAGVRDGMMSLVMGTQLKYTKKTYLKKML